MNTEKEAIRLIDRLYKDLYLSEEVLNHKVINKHDKFTNIKNYLNKLEEMHKVVSTTGKHKEFLKDLYYDKYIIKAEDIPESYYKHRQEMSLENGFGYIEITEIQKEEFQHEIIENQKASLNAWLDYFLSEESNIYPFWAKYWAFQGMLKLGAYDKQTSTFSKRRKDTVTSFIELNREALALSIDLIIKLLNKTTIEDKELNALVKSGSFQKVYAYVLKNILKETKDITKKNKGLWIKYDKGSDHKILVDSLKGYNTGWCTAGEETAKNQLTNGDFYVYYTLDQNDEYKIPRLAIRLEEKNIVEIRGISENQNIELELEEILEEKIKEFPDIDKYYKKLNDMKMLKKIYTKHQQKEDLTKEEIIFIYEINQDIVGFGYEKDPRIKEIITSRKDIKKDLSYAFDCKEEQIVLQNEIPNEDTIYYQGNFTLNPQTLSILPKYIKGDLILKDINNAKDINLPIAIGGNIDLSCLKSAEGLHLPNYVRKNLYLDNIENEEHLILPEIIGGDLFLTKLKNIKNLKLPKHIRGNLYLPHVKELDNVIMPESIGNSLHLTRVTNANNLVLPKQVGGLVYFDNLTDIEGLIIPDNLTYMIKIKDFVLTRSNINEYRNKKSKK